MLLVPRDAMGNPNGEPIGVATIGGSSFSRVLEKCGATQNGEKLFFRGRMVDFRKEDPEIRQLIDGWQVPKAKSVDHILRLIEAIETDDPGPEGICMHRDLPRNRLTQYFQGLEQERG
ncbi:MAG: hypothetical protein A3C50_00860 [Candidatus Staskawiczbacteria bacterium RIFCSPHIGHO2_02_FULL_43_16]|uniref:Uncharacterized protein n=1 Tax=Candidatus Staskawiczbacteria bacterium RIFCSPHIGHO2_01_FULL_41_41 TaxID=1802203 RepID=A0A1G2HTK8_9BACT|nr:MAG: hypothetical protein A2822_00860 [Candidatus Staskawiczbacteria bacterium RIFCSPHIGHO2_01_FULL_41_41]OGZ68304.1 MAG: hypothetical protein A3C50_00860 [Candidatus Staskawiczbacteria bacterium RIFCSPHIGHO2_02_FULL_43_16]OGZ75095.1 MAG: hypothetical protein A3A12_00385 [Candidatus Staskawiczbacteria bacterium RIFCSPLOWO2_01_FULL_43_17b]